MLAAKTTDPDCIDKIRAPVLDDLQATNTLIYQELASEIPLIQEITQYIIESGGKRLRPLLVLLSARACGYSTAETEHQEIATVVEFLHTATLLHDDVVDASALRRNRKTPNALWGNPASVLVGDFLYSRAFQILARRNNIPVTNCLAETTNAIAEGEVQQLTYRHNPDITPETYHRIIYRKTAKLFEASAKMGAIIANQDPPTQAAMARYGLNLGITFQIVDDLMDYCSHANTMGKNVGDDLADGNPTLPLIVAMQRGNEQEKQLIRTAIIQSKADDMPTILAILKSTGAIQYTLQQARAYADTALLALDALPLPHSKIHDALRQLVEFTVAREY